LVDTPPWTICSFSAWVICASIASARASGVPVVVVVVVVVVEVDDDELPPHAASAQARGKINSKARGDAATMRLSDTGARGAFSGLESCVASIAAQIAPALACSPAP
jgi:hypothetical protein